MMSQDAETTGLAQYIATVLLWAPGHQRKGITTFVGAIIEKQSSTTQAELACGLGTQEAGVKRLLRLRHNEPLVSHRLADAVLAAGPAAVATERQCAVRLAVDWPSDGSPPLLVVSLLTGGRAVLIYGRAYDATVLKGRKVLSQGLRTIPYIETLEHEKYH